MQEDQKYNRGSEWRKWDLHIHTPLSICQNYGGPTDAAWERFISSLENLPSDVKAIGINDYYFIEGYEKVMFFKNIGRLSNIEKIFPVLEFRIDTFASATENKFSKINLHVIFDVDEQNIKDEIAKIKDEFIGNIHLSRSHPTEKLTRENLQNYSSDKKLKTGFAELIPSTKEVLEVINSEQWRKKTFKLLGYLEWNDLEKSIQLKAQKASLYSFADAFFTASENDNIEKKEEVLGFVGNGGAKKPLLHSGDVHNFDFLDTFKLNKLGIREESKNYKCFTWIKADLTFEGLKQIIYEPEQEGRVFIGQIKPDKKEKYKVIDKIIFDVGCKFPEEIKFNSNLCSIIGSRSSGKSALLAYVAHGIDKVLTEERMPDGPGAGISWEDVDFSYKIQWSNGLENEKSLGKIVYVPQNYLFRISSKPDEIKEKIEPVFFNSLPDFKNRYLGSLEAIKSHNKNIGSAIDSWFLSADKIKKITDQVKSFGDKSAIKEEIKGLENSIEEIKKKFSLTEDDVKQYQDISNSLKKKTEKIKVANSDLIQLLSQSENQTEDSSNFFKKVILGLSPSLDDLPEILRKMILCKTTPYENDILKQVNLVVKNYREELEKELVQLKESIEKEKTENKEIIEKNEKNKELRELIDGLNNQNILIEKIDNLEKLKSENLVTLQDNERTIKEEIKKRKSVLYRLQAYLKSLNQDDVDIIFGIEYDIDNIFQDTLIKKINKLETSDFFDKGSFKLSEIRDNPLQFIKKIYSGEQKINIGYKKKDVIKDTLTLTEKILFTAEMEGDKIGGFQKSTMTAGKQALFALKLILGESDDKWPLLIDQPEDDLDSRSIYDHIVPFLKKKKKERQIIMVSHNANLVIGSDSEQIIVSNRNGNDRPNENGKEFNYFPGSIENTKKKNEEKEKIDILNSQGVREHACDVLDGGENAFEHRRNKYNLKK